MEEFKGTKEPWVYVGGDNYSVEINIGESTASLDREDKNTREIVYSREEMEANAKLIASAPELLQALQDIVEAIETEKVVIYDNEAHDSFASTPNRLYKNAKMAIIKALRK